MPYVNKMRKVVIEPCLEELITLLNRKDDEGHLIAGAGDLNFIITKIILAYWKNRSNYQAGCDISGAMHDAYSEFYRRVMKPYEEKKIKENGDVYKESLGSKKLKSK